MLTITVPAELRHSVSTLTLLSLGSRLLSEHRDRPELHSLQIVRERFTNQGATVYIKLIRFEDGRVQEYYSTEPHKGTQSQPGSLVYTTKAS
jgi:hypothetical protein